MKIEKYILCKLDKVYAVSLIQIKDKEHFLAATESEGPCILFHPPDWKKSIVWDGPGGTMNIVPLYNQEKTFLAIQKFFPIFQSENAGIVYAKARKNLYKNWEVTKVLDLPFVHRITIVYIQNVPFLIASTLCGGKNYQDDWSKPGAVYVSTIPNNIKRRWNIQTILNGISKNHAMDLTIIDEQQVILVGGHQGLFKITVPTKLDATWNYEYLIDHEISDTYASDIDDDGRKEIITIEPFHGDKMVIYKEIFGKWKTVYEMEINFGHVLWSGKIFGDTCILVGNRGKEKSLDLLVLKDVKNFAMDSIEIDRDTGATQISVIHKKDHVLFLSANHSSSEVVVYKLSK